MYYERIPNTYVKTSAKSSKIKLGLSLSYMICKISFVISCTHKKEVQTECPVELGTGPAEHLTSIFFIAVTCMSLTT